MKGYEVKLSQEEAVPADLTAIQAHRSALQVGAAHFKECTEKTANALFVEQIPSFSLLNLHCVLFFLSKIATGRTCLPYFTVKIKEQPWPCASTCRHMLMCASLLAAVCPAV